jgi:hypothetical protein
MSDNKDNAYDVSVNSTDAEQKKREEAARKKREEERAALLDAKEREKEEELVAQQSQQTQQSQFVSFVLNVPLEKQKEFAETIKSVSKNGLSGEEFKKYRETFQEAIVAGKPKEGEKGTIEYGGKDQKVHVEISGTEPDKNGEYHIKINVKKGPAEISLPMIGKDGKPTDRMMLLQYDKDGKLKAFAPGEIPLKIDALEILSLQKADQKKLQSEIAKQNEQQKNQQNAESLHNKFNDRTKSSWNTPNPQENNKSLGAERGNPENNNTLNHRNSLDSISSDLSYNERLSLNRLHRSNSSPELFGENSHINEGLKHSLERRNSSPGRLEENSHIVNEERRGSLKRRHSAPERLGKNNTNEPITSEKNEISNKRSRSSSLSLPVDRNVM